MEDCITVEGDYKFEINQQVRYILADGEDQGIFRVLHRYTERLRRNRVAAIPRYVVHDEESNQVLTLSEIVMHLVD